MVTRQSMLIPKKLLFKDTCIYNSVIKIKNTKLPMLKKYGKFRYAICTFQGVKESNIAKELLISKKIEKSELRYKFCK